MKKLLLKTLFPLLLVFPLFISAVEDGEDTENAAGVLFLTGSLQIDDKGVYLESTDCRYSGKYYFGGVLDEDTGDKKVNKKNKKKNKKTAKKVKKWAKKVSKAENKTIPNREIKCTMDEATRTINPLKVISPMFEPVATGLAPICDATLLAIYALYLETERIKSETRVVTYKLEKSEGDDENYAFWDINCRSIGMDQLANMDSEIKNVLTQANVAVAANIAALGLIVAKFKLIKDEIKSLDMLGKAAATASLTQATLFQVRLLNDNKRLRDRIKECKGIIEGFSFDE